MIKIEFSVLGQPKTAGSKKAFYNPKLKRAFITDDNKDSRDWKEQVTSAAHQAYDGPLLREALSMRLVFYRVRPKGHFKSDGSFSKEGNARSTGPATRPDLLKLTRAVEDALKGIIYVDDAQIVSQTLRKRWGEPSRVDVLISEEVD
jgi:Holliday junction resolvase RusA-like endonuclease